MSDIKTERVKLTFEWEFDDFGIWMSVLQVIVIKPLLTRDTEKKLIINLVNISYYYC